MGYMYDLLRRLLLRFPSGFTALRRTPILGSILHWAGYKILPSRISVWTQIDRGEAEGLWIEVYPRTGANCYWGNIEPEVQRLLRERLRLGMIFYDVGANIGFFTMIGAQLLGPHGKVFAFEPELEAVCRLKENVKRNGFSNVFVVEAAVWSMSGSVAFKRCDPSTSTDLGLGRVVPPECGGNAIPVPSTALDDFAKRTLAPNLIKCDVEGAELEVFQGARRLLTQHKPLIICEIHSRDKGAVLRALFERLGYHAKLLNEFGLVADGW